MIWREQMEKVELKKGVYWVGTIDWNIRDFHGYSTPFGTTYNAYLILDEKNVLVDTVKPPKGKIFGLFGSHGWGGGGIKEMRRILEQEKYEIWEKELPAQYVPDSVELTDAIRFGREFAGKAFGG